MKRDMMEELNTRAHSRGMSAMLHLSLLGLLGAHQPMPEPSPTKRGLRTKEWNRRKARRKIARESRKLNRRGA